jgi:hypothetical protein
MHVNEQPQEVHLHITKFNVTRPSALVNAWLSHGSGGKLSCACTIRDATATNVPGP